MWKMLEDVTNVLKSKQVRLTATREVKKLQSCNKVLTRSILLMHFGSRSVLLLLLLWMFDDIETTNTFSLNRPTGPIQS